MVRLLYFGGERHSVTDCSGTSTARRTQGQLAFKRMTDMMLHLDNAPKRAIRLAALAGALIFSTNVWADDDTAVTDPECEGGDVPIADSASGDPSSFAAGCGANANGDGSVAIGDKATTERVNVGDIRILAEGTLTVGDGEPIDIVVEYDPNNPNNVLGYYRDINGDDIIDILEFAHGAESLAAIVHDLDTNKEDNLVPSHHLDVEGTQEERFEEIVPVKNAVAIGPNAAVKGDGGIALGNGATVGRNGKVTRTTTEEVVQKRILAEGTLTVGDGEPIEIVVEYDADNKVLGYYRDFDGDGDADKYDVEDGEAESLAAIVHDLDTNKEDNLVPSHFLDVEGTQEVEFTQEQVTVVFVDEIPATNGIAIGNGAAVMGDNGIRHRC